MHLVAAGDGSPAVVMIAGMGDFSLDWALVQPKVAMFTRACAYDRAGDAWSDSASGSIMGLREQANDLHTLLEKAGISPPFVLVGHSWGGAIARVYAAEHPTEVAGMVLVDSTHEDSLLWLNGKVFRPRTVTADEWAKVWKPLPADFKPMPIRLRRPEQVGSPFDKLPPDIQKLRLWAMGSQLFTPTDFRADLGALHAARGKEEFPLEDRPLFVLTRGLPATDEEKDWTIEQQEQDHQRLQADLTTLSRNSRLVVAERSGHRVQLDQPELVVTAVRQVVNAVRNGDKLGTTNP